MKAWLGSVLLVIVGGFAVASGCGSPQVVTQGGIDGNSGGSAGTGGTGAGASAGTLVFGDGGDNSTQGCPSTCDELGANCGFVTDKKCGGAVQCGTCTTKGEVCGGQEPNRCGKPSTMTDPDAGACTPSTCAELKASCGSVSDPKCPGTVVDCGADACPGHCTNGTCTTTTCVVDPATTCAGKGYACGQTVDNCGNVLDCGPTDCGGNGDSCVQGVCTAPPPCVVDPATTCAGRGYTCGQAADNCGHLLTCGSSTCSTPGWTCGGGSDASGNSIPGVCGCTGACSQIPTCDAGVTTTLTGKVYDPAGRNPLYHVLVYVANSPSDPNLKTFPAGLTCDVCGASAAGDPLISTPGQTDPPAGEYTGVDGSFTLKNVPAGNVTLVIQLGRWRRTFPVNVANACKANSVTDKTLLMPATKAQGNIPLMAMVTGNADSLECVLRKMGIDKSEFTNPGAGGRVNFFLGDQKPGQGIDGTTPSQSALFANNTINNYDMTILACQGAAYDESANQTALRNYADHGGRVFATHYEYTWLYKNNGNVSNVADPTADNWGGVAQWHVDEGDRSATDTTPITGIIDKVTNPKGNAFQGWLENVGASTPGSGKTTVYVVRHDTDFISPVSGRTQQWLYRAGDNARACAITGDTCTGNGTGAGLCAPKVCSTATNQTCNSNNDCTANVCSNNTSKSCNRDSDCGGNNKCRANTCKDNTCQGTDYTGQQTPLHFTFNAPVNLKEDLTKTPPQVQCGRVLFSDFHVDTANENSSQFYPSQCALNVARATPNSAGGGKCTSDAQCTGTCSGGKCPWGTACSANADCASTCSGGICLDPMTAQEKLLEYMIFDLGSCVPPTTTCTPKTACPAGQNCGYAPDGCGGLVACGTCPTGEQCGVGQPPVANQCGKITCTPNACPSGQECGYASDGCNGVANCGTCPTGQTCNNGKCGSTACTPKSCTDQNIQCGQAGDECGNVLTCPACPANSQCVAGACVPLTCVPLSCAKQGIECGQAADGCGNKIASCGECSSGDLCVAGQCVHVN